MHVRGLAILSTMAYYNNSCYTNLYHAGGRTQHIHKFVSVSICAWCYVCCLALACCTKPEEDPRDRNVEVKNELFVQSKAVNLFSRINSS